jgi:hypothetical protein
MAVDGLVCVACGTFGFLVDKVSLFPFVAGVGLGMIMPPRVIAQLDPLGALSRAFVACSKSMSFKKDDTSVKEDGGLNMDVHDD